LLLNLLFLIVTLTALHIGSQFMPPLFEGSALYMPTALPGISIGQASQLLQEQDRIIRTFPEVETVFGSIGRSDSANDNAPLDNVRHDDHAQAASQCGWNDLRKAHSGNGHELQFPGLSNTWTMPVENRLDMELTGIKTPLGLKIQGPNLEGIQQVGAQVTADLSAIPETRSIFAERVSQGFYLNIEVSRAEAARYGLTIADVQQAVTSGIGGEMVAENVEGRERYPVMSGTTATLGTRGRVAPGVDWHAFWRADSNFSAAILIGIMEGPQRTRLRDFEIGICAPEGVPINTRRNSSTLSLKSRLYRTFTDTARGLYVFSDHLAADSRSNCLLHVSDRQPVASRFCPAHFDVEIKTLRTRSAKWNAFQESLRGSAVPARQLAGCPPGLALESSTKWRFDSR